MVRILVLIVFILHPIYSFGDYTDYGDGKIRDNLTNLVWQKCSKDLNNDSTCSGSVANTSWVDAISYCENLTLGGHSDWRLPNVNELLSINDSSAVNPSINTYFFPNTFNGNYWSSSTNIVWTGLRTLVDFSSGYITHYGSTSSPVGVRCVRGP